MKMRELLNIINEVEVGGGVDSAFLDDSKGKHYTNRQYDLFPEIPTLDPELPPGMEIVGKIGAFRVVRSDGELRDGLVFVLFDRHIPIAKIAIMNPSKDDHRGARSLASFLDPAGYVVKSVYVKEDYRGQKIAPRLYDWLLRNVCDYLIADSLQTRKGMRMWQRFLTSKKFDVEVYDDDRYWSRRRWPGKDFDAVYDINRKETGAYHLVPWITLPGKAAALKDRAGQ